MAKTKAKPKPPTSLQRTKGAALEPKRVHELFQLAEPYDPRAEPPACPDRITIWDPGLSIVEMRSKFPQLFCPMDWYGQEWFAKQRSPGTWRQFWSEPLCRGKTYSEQVAKLPHGDEVPSARDVVSMLIVRFLTTGQRGEGSNYRCKDLLSSERRVIVILTEHGFDIANVSDAWALPTLGLASVLTPLLPPRMRKRRWK